MATPLPILLHDSDDEGTQTLTSLVFQRLRSDILQGRLRPGSRLRVDALREMYGAGGSPLREALVRLISDGFVVGQEQRGFSVAAISRADLDDLVRARQLTDCTALREAMRRKDDAWEALVVGAHYRLSRFEMSAQDDAGAINEEWELRHREFHKALVAGCQSRRVIEHSNLLYDQSDRYRRIAHAFGVRPRTPSEHESLLDAVVDRNEERACSELAQHYELTRSIIVEALGREGPTGAGDE